MSKKNEETALATLGTFAIAKHDPEAVAGIIASNLGAGGISEFDLDRVKVPAGGSKYWTVPTVDGEEEAEQIDGVIVGWKECRAYWKESFDQTGGGTPPDCHSEDSVTGVGDPGGDCATCAFAQFGSDGRAQACKQMRLLFVLREKDLLPVVIVCPPSSLRDSRRYFLRLASNAIPYYGVLSGFKLEKDKNKDGIAYSRISPLMVRQLSPQETERTKAYAATIAPVIQSVSIVQAVSESEEPPF